MHQQISIHGLKVIVTRGPDTTTHYAGSHTEAVDLAARLEAAHEVDQARRAALLAYYIEAGVDVVLPAEPEPEATEVRVVGDGIDFDYSGPVEGLRDAALAAGITEFTDDGVPLAPLPAPASALVEAPTATETPAVADDEEPAPELAGGLPVAATARWEPTSERMIVTFQPTEEATLWRRMGNRSATFTIGPDSPSLTRMFKASTSERLEIRVGGPDGPLILTAAVPDQ